MSKRPKLPHRPVRSWDWYPRWLDNEGWETVSVPIGSFRATLLDDEDLEDEQLVSFLKSIAGEYWEDIEEEALSGDYDEGFFLDVGLKEMRLFSEAYGLDLETVRVVQNASSSYIKWYLQGQFQHSDEEFAEAAAKKVQDEAEFQKREAEWEKLRDEWEIAVAEWDLQQVRERHARKHRKA